MTATPKMIAARASFMSGREPYLTAAATLLAESGCVVARWRKNSASGSADITSEDWRISVPEPRGPISYSTFAHEVAHQILHRRGNGRKRLARWHEELEAHLYALSTFDRFDLPGFDKAQADACMCMGYAITKALRRSKTAATRKVLYGTIYSTVPMWMVDSREPRPAEIPVPR